jgi:hypothetical protein
MIVSNYFGINLFFDGNTEPGISVFTSTSGGPVSVIPGTVTDTPNMAGVLVDTSAGSATYAGFTELTGFSFALPATPPFTQGPYGSFTQGPNGTTVPAGTYTYGDYVGSLQLDNLSPEPATVSLVGGALLTLLVGVRRYRRS